MNNTLVKQLGEQLKSIVESYEGLRSQSKYDDLSDLGETTAHNLIARSTAAIERASGRDSPYSRQVQEILARETNDFDKLSMIIGVVESLVADIQAGYLYSVSELIHGEIFGDFLEMAGHLLDVTLHPYAVLATGSGGSWPVCR